MIFDGAGFPGSTGTLAGGMESRFFDGFESASGGLPISSGGKGFSSAIAVPIELAGLVGITVGSSGGFDGEAFCGTAVGFG